MSLDGARVVVVGASSGIGAALARRVAHDGGAPVLVSRSADRLAAVAADLPGRPHVEAVDALELDALREAFGRIGPFDHLAVTAVADETKLMGRIADLDDERVSRGLEKLHITLNAVRAATPHLREGGSVTLTSSTAISHPPRGGGSSVMNAASGAVAVLARALAAELAPTRVNAVAPGVVATGVWDDEGRESLREWARTLPVGHLGEPEELADAYRFLMTATYVTGVVLPVDGGIAFT